MILENDNDITLYSWRMQKCQRSTHCVYSQVVGWAVL